MIQLLFLIFLFLATPAFAAPTFKEVCSEPLKTTYGIKSCTGFDSESEIYYDATSLGGAVCAAETFLSNHVNGNNNTITNDIQSGGNTLAIQQTVTGQGNTCVYPKLDFSRRLSGNASLRITTPSGADSGAGGEFRSYFERAGSPQSYTFGWYGPGSDFWFRVAIFDSNEVITNKYDLLAGTGGTKRLLIHGAAASGSIETALQDTDQIEVVQAYGGPSKVPYDQQQASIGCGPTASLDPADFPNPPCRHWQAGQWVVYHIHHIIPDPATSSNATVEIYINDESTPVVKTTTANYENLTTQALTAGYTTGNTYEADADPEGGFGQYSLTNFHTSKDPAQSHTAASVWYDEVIISDSRIPALTPTTEISSVLKSAAVTMSAGEWKTIETVGLDAAIDDTGTDKTIFSDMNQGYYDAANDSIYIIGGDHSIPPDHYMKFVTYDEATNTWVLEFESTDGFFGDKDQHAYDETWLDTVNGRFGFSTKGYCDTPCQDKVQANFSTLTETGIVFASRGNNAYEYFPNVGLMRIANTNIRKLVDQGSTWELVDTFAVDPQIEPFMEYNPVYKEMLVGGGSNSDALFVIDEAETKTGIATCPGTTGECHVATALLNTDVNGDYIFVACNADVYKYQHSDNTWNFLENQGTLFFNSGAACRVSNTIGINIPEYRVTMYVKFRLGGDSEVFLYKHSDPSGNPKTQTNPFNWFDPFTWF